MRAETAEIEQVVTTMPGRAPVEHEEDTDAGARRSRLEAVNAVAARRREVRERVEALTVRETTGEEQRSSSNHPIPGGLVSSTRYLLECAYRGPGHPRALID